MLKPLAAVAVLGLTTTWAPLAQAQAAWPTAKPISIIVPFTAGGSVDTTARLLADELGKRLKQSVVVDNVTGAGGTVGVAKGANAAPDGYTLVMGADSPIAIAPYANPKAVRYDVARDLVPVGLVNTAPLLLVAKPDLPVKNLAELVALAKKEPGKLNYATSGIGTVLHLGMEMIKQQGHFFATHVPYRGGAQIATDVIGGQVDLAMLVSVSAAPHVNAGKLKPIAVTGAQRLSILPNVPTVAETPGFKGYDVVSWSGLFAPAGTPQPVIDQLNQTLNAVLSSPEVRRKMQDQGAVAGSGSAQDFGAFVQREQKRYAQAVQTAGIKE
ncbi:MAG: tripartite tricarboxylate transporter substrate binding protein [Proteobacteria bacterium]|nr:tripartite tricarboxylate transporter substrate binding protein [Pseudomonadota bacterium]